MNLDPNPKYVVHGDDILRSYMHFNLVPSYVMDWMALNPQNPHPHPHTHTNL